MYVLFVCIIIKRDSKYVLEKEPTNQTYSLLAEVKCCHLELGCGIFRILRKQLGGI